MKQHAPATDRNREPIRDVLARVLPRTGVVLEVASGTGEHAVFMARAFPYLDWQPSDGDPDALASIAAWRDDDPPANLRAPLRLDASAETWPIAHADAIACINMIHISPWQATLGLVAGAARVLPSDGLLYLYGPYIVEGETAPSNRAFDRSLRERDPRWGVRELRGVEAAARAVGFALTETVAMPANNLSVVFRLREP
jgi:hypothetical protein